MCRKIDEALTVNHRQIDVARVSDPLPGAVRPRRNLLPLLRLAVFVRGGPQQPARQRIDRHQDAGLRRADHDSVAVGRGRDQGEPLMVGADRLRHRTQHLAPDEIPILRLQTRQIQQLVRFTDGEQMVCPREAADRGK